MGQEMFMKGIFAANNEHCLSGSKNMLIQMTVKDIQDILIQMAVNS